MLTLEVNYYTAKFLSKNFFHWKSRQRNRTSKYLFLGCSCYLSLQFTSHPLCLGLDNCWWILPGALYIFSFPKFIFLKKYFNLYTQMCSLNLKPWDWVTCSTNSHPGTPKFIFFKEKWLISLVTICLPVISLAISIMQTFVLLNSSSIKSWSPIWPSTYFHISYSKATLVFSNFWTQQTMAQESNPAHCLLL